MVMAGTMLQQLPLQRLLFLLICVRFDRLDQRDMARRRELILISEARLMFV
jgi:hypothetical protein